MDYNIIDSLDELLFVNKKYDKDVKIFALICLDICNLMSNEFDLMQIKELGAARYYWASDCLDGEQERLDALESLRKRTENLSPSNQSRKQLIDRFLVGSLNPITELSSYSAEYIVDFADRLEIDRQEINKIFKRYIPELQNLESEQN